MPIYRLQDGKMILEESSIAPDYKNADGSVNWDLLRTDLHLEREIQLIPWDEADNRAAANESGPVRVNTEEMKKLEDKIREELREKMEIEQAEMIKIAVNLAVRDELARLKVGGKQKPPEQVDPKQEQVAKTEAQQPRKDAAVIEDGDPLDQEPQDQN